MLFEFTIRHTLKAEFAFFKRSKKLTMWPNNKDNFEKNTTSDYSCQAWQNVDAKKIKIKYT